MEETPNNAAPEQAKENFDAFDNMSTEFGEEKAFKSVDEMPKTESNEKGFDDFDKELKGEKVVEEKKSDEKSEVKKDTKEVVAEDPKQEKEEKIVEKDKEDSDEDKSPELEFDPEKFKFEKVEGEGESESSWVDLGKDLGIEVKDNSFEAYKEALERVKSEAKEAGKAEASRIELEKFSPDAQKAIEFLTLNPEASINDFMNPLKRIDEALTMDNESLLRADFEAKGWEADRIEERLQILSDEGKLESEAYALRQDIKNVRISTEAQLVDDAKQAAFARQQQAQEVQRKEDESIVNAIKGVKTFMGFKIPDSAKQYLQKQWESGEVRKAFQSNPEEVVQFMLNKYIGQEALKELKKTQFQKGRDEIQGKLHNTKELSSSESSGRREVRKSTTSNPGDPFSAWEDIETDKATVDNNGY